MIHFISHLLELKEDPLATIKVTPRSLAISTMTLTIEARWASTPIRWAHLGSWSRHLHHQQDLILINTMIEAGRRAPILHKSMSKATMGCLRACSKGPSSQIVMICLTMDSSVEARHRCGKAAHIMISTRTKASWDMKDPKTLFLINSTEEWEVSGMLLSTMMSLASLRCTQMAPSRDLNPSIRCTAPDKVPGPV